MQKRYAVLWFPYLLTDWYLRSHAQYQQVPVVFVMPVQGRVLITASNNLAQQLGVMPDMLLADARAAVPQLHVLQDKPLRREKLLKALALWCIKFTPIVSLDEYGSILLDISGCTHLWGAEQDYLSAIVDQLASKGYQAYLCSAGTIGAAWAAAHYSCGTRLVEEGKQLALLGDLPPEALRLERSTVDRLYKLGFRTLASFASIPVTVLKRRFTADIVTRLQQFLGKSEEYLTPVQPILPYTERLPCLEPICTDKSIEVAIGKLLNNLCQRLAGEGKGLRKAKLSCYRVDGKVQSVEIGTNRPSAHVPHLCGLFSQKIGQIAPGLGIELFIMDALMVDDAPSLQELLWKGNIGLADNDIVELLDKIKARDRYCRINRYLPNAQHWPERSIRPAATLNEKKTIAWPFDRPRPTRMLHPPHAIEVAAPIPDYPPMLFRYQGQVHHIKRADGPERIEREWWLEAGEHRDYYYVEDEQGRRYWLFRLGHYTTDVSPEWYLHGFFA
ncbi:Y-family DNA polymerase [Sphingobacterium bambusae]|uniref:DNA polymerase Y family protein n=1 Tax=Sphingobacterium bambusae TaxID=662858 RepID=A0ABW6BL87_9SPHI|nr:DNA polymerase Y family protein [Sphingobacterium bambusae]WPL49032.1 DNA polymerase Y family protein [Sphingobacterium bambusae]